MKAEEESEPTRLRVMMGVQKKIEEVDKVMN